MSATTKEELEALEKEAARLHKEAKEHNMAGRFEEAKDAYLKMYSVEDQSLALAAELVHGVERELPPPEYQLTYRPPRWPSADCRRRARGAVLGYFVADAAAMGVHWVYDLQVLESLDLARGGSGRLDFYDPPQSPYFSYASGRASPYGEQVRNLLSSLVGQGGFSAMANAEALAAMYGDGWDGYRDASVKGFLRNWYRGRSPPQSGADDCQANCFTRVAPIVALFGGGEDASLLMRVVEYATRVTQNHHTAVAWGLGAARLLELVVMGRSVQQATEQTVAELRDEGSVLGGYISDKVEDGDGLREEVAYYLQQCLSASKSKSVAMAVAGFGRNCHLPNSMQTPVHAALHHSPTGGSDDGPTASSVFLAAVRAAVREGGCCASRAGFVGALLGAAMGPQAVPEEWSRQVQGWEGLEHETEALLRLRD